MCLLLAGARSYAQDQAPAGEAPAAAVLPDASPESQELEAAPTEMVVTGSRIRRGTFSQPSAVEIVDQKAIERSGAHTALDLIKYLTTNSGSDLNTDITNGTPGTASFNLRGLGVDSTLVLLNGRRLTVSGVESSDGANFVDINSIPLAAIERIEILKGGGSALYGSDAVAGVVNIITRRNYEGVQVQLGGQATDSFDQHEWDVSVVAGVHGKRTDLFAAISFFDRQPLSAADRSFTNNGRNTSNLGWPSTFLAQRPASMGGTFAFRDPGCGRPEFPGSYPTRDANPPLPFCAFDFNSYYQLIPTEQRLQTFSSLQHDLSDHVSLFAETLYARIRAERSSSPSAPLLQSFVVPSDHIFNPTGYPLRWYGRALGSNAPGSTTPFETDTIHVAGGLKGDLGGVFPEIARLRDWEWQAVATWSANRSRVYVRDLLTTDLQSALNSCKPTDDLTGCWNPFSFGAPNSDALTQRLYGKAQNLRDTSLATIGVDLHGPLLRLPGGDLALAVGAQARRETVSTYQDHDANEQAYAFLSGVDDYRAQRRVAAAYGELSLPFARGLELQAAARAERFEDVGTSINPMAGFSWVPATTFQGERAAAVTKARLRGTFATSFRAPSLLQTFGQQRTLEELYNYRAVDGKPMQATTSTYLAVETNGNPNLKPQTARALSLGVEWAPLAGLLVTTDYWNYDYKNIIVKQSAQQLLAADYDCDPASAAQFCDAAISRDPSGLAQSVSTRFANEQSVTTHGLDFGLTYRAPLAADMSWSLGATGSYVFAYTIPESSVGPLVRDRIATCEGGRCDVAGLRNSVNFARPLPRLRMTFPLAWSMGPHTASLIVHFISGYRDDNDSDPSPDRVDFQKVSAFTSFDLQYALRLTQGGGYKTDLRLGVMNLFDSDPPSVNAALGYDVFTHDPRGRMLYARLTQEL